MVGIACPKPIVQKEQKQYLSYGRNYKSWNKLTDRKVISSHGKTNTEIFANAKAYEVNAGTKLLPYSEGSIFVVLHYNIEDELLPYVYLMRKMKEGYDPDNNNWRYSVVNISDWSIQRDGILVDCIKCHQQRRERDYTPLMKKDLNQQIF